MKSRFALAAAAGFLLTLITTSATAATVTIPLRDFVIFSGGGLTVSGGDETSIGGHTLINGNIGSDQDLFLQGNPLAGYPAQLNGSAYAGGSIFFGQDLTNGSSSGPLREVVANGAASISGGADIYGNLYANAVTLGQDTRIRQVGGVGGNVEYTASYSPSGGGTPSIVEGTVSTPSTKTFGLITMPPATVFTAGGPNQSVPTGQGNSLTLAPGTYGALATSSQNQFVELSSGNYYFDSITSQGGFGLKIDLTSGNPINIYVVGDVALAGRQTLLVKGAGTGGLFVPISQASSLASLIYMETHGRFTMTGGLDGTHNIWGGTVYASLLEATSAEISIGQYTDWYGAAWAYDSFDTADHGFWNHVPLVCTLNLSETHVNVLCYGGTSGSINLSVSGGTSPYTFAWSNGATTEDLSGMAAGTYTVAVTDAKGCTADTSVTITQPTSPLVANAGVNQTICSGGSATLNASATGGTGPYSFSWDQGLGSGATKTVSPTANTTYTVTVTDANGCQNSASVTVMVNNCAPAALGDFVWQDLNGDGIQNTNEPGVSNVVVILMSCAGTPIATNLTDATGYYLFTGLAAGDYKVNFVPPANYVFTIADAGANDGLDSDANATNGMTGCYTLAAGQTNLTVDAGLVSGIVVCSPCEPAPANTPGQINRDLASYVLFAFEDLSWKGGNSAGRGYVSGGNVGLNREDEKPNDNTRYFNVGQNGRFIMSDNTHAVFDVGTVGDVANVYDIHWRTNLNLSPTAIVRGTSYRDFVPPIINITNNPTYGCPDLFPAFTASTNAADDITVPVNGTLGSLATPLAPGTYRDFTARDGSTVFFGPGTYTFRSWHLGTPTRIFTTPCTVIRVQGDTDPNSNDFNFGGNGSFLGSYATWQGSTNCADEAIAQFQLLVKAINFSDSSIFYGEILAPCSTSTGAGRGNTIYGRIVSREIHSDFNTDIYYRKSCCASTPGATDFGDAPTAGQSGFAGSYPVTLAQNGAYHVATGPTLGTARDTELDGQPSPLADGDDTTGVPDDEDGVTIPSLYRGETVNLTVNASAPARLDAWIDWNRDGDWADAGEQVAVNLSVLAGNNTLAVAVPANAPLGVSFARFRLSSAGNLPVTGGAVDGEVEDYRVNITDHPTAAVLEWFRGTAVGNQVSLQWKTLSEDGVIGYEIRRTGAGNTVVVTPEPVWAEGRWFGSLYEVKDTSGVAAGAWNYVLVVLNDDGTEDLLRTVRVTVTGEDPDGATTGDQARITSIERVEGGLRIRWHGGQGPYVLERSGTMGTGAAWTACEVADPNATEAVVPLEGESGFFRVRSAN